MSNQKQSNRPRGPMGHGMRGGGEKAKDFKGTMKKLFNYIKPFKFTFLIGILCAVVSVCIMVIGPKIQGNIITEIAEGFMKKDVCLIISYLCHEYGLLVYSRLVDEWRFQ